MSKSDPYDLVGAFSCRCIRSGFDPLTWLHSKLFASSDVLVSVDHLSPAASPLAGTKAPTVLNVRCGDFVIVEGQQQVALQKNENWWWDR